MTLTRLRDLIAVTVPYRNRRYTGGNSSADRISGREFPFLEVTPPSPPGTKFVILAEAGAASATPGAAGALLRREGLYSSHPVTWHRERGNGILKTVRESH